MQKNKKIKALFFLSVFSVLLLHHIFPHFHHQHEVIKTAETHHHDDHHHHHDESPDEDDDSKENLFNFLFGMHVHAFVVDEVPFVKYSINKLKKAETVDVISSYSTFLVFSIDSKEIEDPAIYDPPNYFSISYIHSLKTRGPPVLG